MGVAEDKQLLGAAQNGNTSEALRLIEQKVANVNCTDSVRRSGEESTARALRVWGGKGKRRQRHIVCMQGGGGGGEAPRHIRGTRLREGHRLIAVAALVPPR